MERIFAAPGVCARVPFVQAGGVGSIRPGPAGDPGCVRRGGGPGWGRRGRGWGRTTALLAPARPRRRPSPRQEGRMEPPASQVLRPGSLGRTRARGTEARRVLPAMEPLPPPGPRSLPCGSVPCLVSASSSGRGRPRSATGSGPSEPDNGKLARPGSRAPDGSITNAVLGSLRIPNGPGAAAGSSGSAGPGPATRSQRREGFQRDPLRWRGGW